MSFPGTSIQPPDCSECQRFCKREKRYSLNRCCCRFFICLFLCINTAFAQQSNDRIRRIGVDDGLAGFMVQSISKDKFGYIWIGTNNGLQRFDGISFKTYRAGDDSGLPSSVITRVIYLDPSGNLWVVCNNRHILRYDYQSDKFTLIKNFPEKQVINSIVIDSKQNMWIGGMFGLDLLRATDHTQNPYDKPGTFVKPSIFMKTIVNKIVEYQDSILFVATDNGIYRFNTGSTDTVIAHFTFTTRNYKDLANSISGFIIDRFNSVWISTGNGLIRQSLKDFQYTAGEHPLPFAPIALRKDKNSDQQRFIIMTMLYDNEDCLYLKTIDGIYRYNLISSECELLIKDPYPTYNFSTYGSSLLAFYFNDVDRMLWTGLNKGLAIINTSKSKFKPLTGIPSDFTETFDHNLLQVFVDSEDRLWLSTYRYELIKGEKINKTSAYRFRRYYPDPSKSGTSAAGYITIQEPIKGKMYLAYSDIKKCYLKNNEPVFGNYPFRIDTPVQFFYSQPSTPQGIYSNYFVFAENFLWTLNNGFGTFLSDTLSGKTYHFYLDEKQLRFPALQLTRSNNNQYFILGQNRKIYRLTFPLIQSEKAGYTPSKYELLSDSDSWSRLIGKFIITPVGNDKVFWFKTYNQGIVEYILREPVKTAYTKASEAKLEFVKNYNIDHGLASNDVFNLISDNQNRIWVSTFNGLSCIDPLNDKVYNFYETDGLPDNRINHGCSADSRGNIFMATMHGLMVFHPDSVLNSYSKPSVLISNIYLHDRLVLPEGNQQAVPAVKDHGYLRFTADDTPLKLELTSLNFIDPASVTFRYKMEGIDSGWITAGHEKVISFPKLKRGHYTLRLVAVLKNGLLQSDELTLNIDVFAPFYASVWFFFLLTVTFSAGIYLLSKIRERNLKARASWLEKTVLKKTAELLGTRNEENMMKTGNHWEIPETLVLLPDSERYDESHLEDKAGKKINPVLPHGTHRYGNNKDNEFISRALTIIESNIIRSEFSVEDLAREMNLTSRTLQRRIHAITGLNTVRFIRRIRIEYASRLIAEHQADISEAAYESGFSSLSYFTRAFREVKGTTPTDFRKRNSG